MLGGSHRLTATISLEPALFFCNCFYADCSIAAFIDGIVITQMSDHISSQLFQPLLLLLQLAAYFSGDQSREIIIIRLCWSLSPTCYQHSPLGSAGVKNFLQTRCPSVNQSTVSKHLSKLCRRVSMARSELELTGHNAAIT